MASPVVSFNLAGWVLIEFPVEAALVSPVHPLSGRDLEVID